jgi:hypothetical protein
VERRGEIGEGERNGVGEPRDGGHAQRIVSAFETLGGDTSVGIKCRGELSRSAFKRARQSERLGWLAGRDQGLCVNSIGRKHK